jgi:hypothetical protein
MDRDKWWAVPKAVVSLQVPLSGGFLNQLWDQPTNSSRNLLYGVSYRFVLAKSGIVI